MIYFYFFPVILNNTLANSNILILKQRVRFPEINAEGVATSGKWMDGVLQPAWLAYLFCQLKTSSGARSANAGWHLGIRVDFLDHANSLNSRRIFLDRAAEWKREKKERQTDKEIETKIIMDVRFKHCNWKQMGKAR